MRGDYGVQAFSESLDVGQDAVDEVGFDHEVDVELEVVQSHFFLEAARQQLVVVEARQREEQTQVLDLHAVEREAGLELVEARGVADHFAERELVLVGERLHVRHGPHEAAVETADVRQADSLAHDHFPEGFAEAHVENALVEDAAPADGSEDAPRGLVFGDSQQACGARVAGSREEREVVSVSPHGLASILEVVGQERVELERGAEA